ncbi:MAG: transporter substrate-binding domain-containing protein [Gammaproteobacteria bacterium]|nr:transporter substrate-binding domain-containing protein [Gammaproteobacteria bacterium]
MEGDQRQARDCPGTGGYGNRFILLLPKAHGVVMSHCRPAPLMNRPCHRTIRVACLATIPIGRRCPEWTLCSLRAAVLAMLFASGAALAQGLDACTEEGRVLKIGFFHDFVPVSYSAEPIPGSTGFHEHRGYEAALLTALEAMGAARFSRRAVGGAFFGIWLKAATPEYDLIGGGITIREDRTRDAGGQRVVVFTSGHIAFVQTLLVRAGDAGRFVGYRHFTPEVRIAAVPGTTGEERLLQLTGYVGPDGALRSGTRIHLASGKVLEAGSDRRFVVTAARSSPELVDRRQLEPPENAEDMPQVIYYHGESAHLEALRIGAVDAVARGMIGNADAVAESVGTFAIGARDPRRELGGFALAVSDRLLASCLDRNIARLTDSGRIGYEQWRVDPTVFLRRAENAGKRAGG